MFVCTLPSMVQGQPGMNPLDELRLLSPVLKQAGLAVCGGVKLETVVEIAPYGPEIVVVRGFITGHEEPRRAALEIRERFG